MSMGLSNKRSHAELLNEKGILPATLQKQCSIARVFVCILGLQNLESTAFGASILL